MNRIAVAKELVRLAKELAADSQRELRIITMDDAMSGTDMLSLKVVHRGTMEEVNAWARKKGMVWRPIREQMFGGYWMDRDSGNAYIIT